MDGRWHRICSISQRRIGVLTESVEVVIFKYLNLNTYSVLFRGNFYWWGAVGASFQIPSPSYTPMSYVPYLGPLAGKTIDRVCIASVIGLAVTTDREVYGWGTATYKPGSSSSTPELMPGTSPLQAEGILDLQCTGSQAVILSGTGKVSFSI